MTDLPAEHAVPFVADCDETVRCLYHFIDGELTEDVRSAIAAHLNECPPCVEIVAFEKELRVVIADRCQERVPEALRERIALALRDEADPAGQDVH